MASVAICYVDEEIARAERYRQRLSRSSDIECRLVSPPPLGQIEELTRDPPDLFLIDYQLAAQRENGARASYQGSTLADAIRDRVPDYPIVLITRQPILHELSKQRRRQLTERMQLFDELILKDLLDDQLDKAHHLLVSLSEGFRVLREIEEKTWEALAGILRASQTELEILGEAAPPLEGKEWITTGIAHWIRKVILEFPGIVYDPIHAATRLGISKQSFQNEEVQELFEPAEYGGIFDPLEGRWWKGRLLEIAKDLALRVGVEGPTNKVFAVAFQERYDLKLSPATCVWDHTPIADWVCHVLRQPVKMKNSLRYHPDTRPDVMDDARVSFRAIRESEEFNEAYLDPGGLRLLDEILEEPEP